MTVYEMEYDEPDITVSLTTSSATVTVGDSVTLTATILDNSVPVDDVEVTFKQAGNLIGTSNTNSSGVATFTYTPNNIGVQGLTASYSNIISDSVSLTVNKHTTTTTMTTDHSTVLVLSDVLLTATVLDEEDNPVVNEYVDFYAKWTSQPSYLAPGRTDSNGVATYSYHTNRTGDIEVYAVHGASNYYARSESTHVTLKVTNYTLDVELSIGQIVGSRATFNLTAKHEGSLVTDSLTFKLYENNTQIQSGTLTTGSANLVVNNASGTYKVVIEESTNYPESESNTVTV